MGQNIFGQKEYHSFNKFKSSLFRPILSLLTLFGFSANLLSYLGIVFMLSFVFLLKINLYSALVLLIPAVFLDMFDGALARYQKKDSDKGKFIDMVCDVFVFSLYVVGLVYNSLVNPIIGLSLVLLLISSKLFRSVYHSQFFKSNWKFKAVAGFFPNLLVDLSYASFVLILFGLEVDNIFKIFNLFLLIDSLIFYSKVVRMK